MATFSITDNESNPIENATIQIEDNTLQSNSEGVAEISLTNGTYSFTVTKEGMEDYESSFTIDGADETILVEMILSNINANLVSNFSLYPNPNDGQLNIKLPVDAGRSVIEIISIHGSLVHKEVANDQNSIVQLNISQPQGVYFVRVTMQNGEVLTSKLIIQ